LIHVRLEALAQLLDQAKVGLLFPYYPLAGERPGTVWRKPVRYLAACVEKSMQAAGHKSISWGKGGRFINAVCGALELAGLRERVPSAVAAALTKSTVQVRGLA
jgi:hypothetical protein